MRYRTKSVTSAQVADLGYIVLQLVDASTASPFKLSRIANHDTNSSGLKEHLQQARAGDLVQARAT